MIVAVSQVWDTGPSGQSRNGNKRVDSYVNYVSEERKDKEGESREIYFTK